MMLRTIELVDEQIHRNLRLHGSSLELVAGGFSGTAIRVLLVLNRQHRADNRSLAVRYRFLGPATYLTTNSFPRLGFNRRTAQIEELVETCLLSVAPHYNNVLMHLDVTSANGSTRVHSVNAASALLLRQGHMNQSTFAISIGRTGDQLVADVNYAQDSQGDLDLCIGLKVDAQGRVVPQFTFLQQEGVLSFTELSKACDLAHEQIVHLTKVLWTKPTYHQSPIGATARVTPAIGGVEPFLTQLTYLNERAEALEDRSLWIRHREGNFIRGYDAYGNQLSLAVSVNFDALEPSLKVTYEPGADFAYGRWAREPCLDARLIDRLMRVQVRLHQLLLPKDSGAPRVQVVFAAVRGLLSYRLLEFLLRQVIGDLCTEHGLQQAFPQTLSLRLFRFDRGQFVQISGQDMRVDQRPTLHVFTREDQIVLLQKQGIGTLPVDKTLALLSSL